MSGSKRGVKNKHTALAGQEFFSLGSSVPGPSSSSSNMAAQGMPKLPTKRPEMSSFQQPAAKRPKLNSPLQTVSQVPSPSISPLPMGAQSVIRSPASASMGGSTVPKANWEERAIVVPSKELKDKILEYDGRFDNESEEMIERLLCGAAKLLREQKTKPDSCLVLTLTYIAKIRPLFFNSNLVVEAFSSLLKRESLNNFVKTKNNLVPVLVVNLFQRAFHDEPSWPEIFIKMYIEDSLGDRVWVDNEECKDFVDIIIASFKTKLPKQSQLHTSDVTQKPPTESQTLSSFSAGTDDSSMGGDGETSCSSNPSTYSDQGIRMDSGGQTITSRYADSEKFVIEYVTKVITDHIERRQNVNDVSRNMLRLLMVTAGIRNIRLLVMQKLELWFQNPKLARPSQDLLLTVCLNCNETDTDTLNYLLKMRFKNKTYINHYISCFKELLNKDDGTFDTVLRLVICNELAGIRHLNNFQLISIIFQLRPERASVTLAKVFVHFVFNKDDFLRALRLLMREIVRQLRHENVNFLLFVTTMLDESRVYTEKLEWQQIEEEVKRRAPLTIVDLISNVMLLSIGNNVREAFNTTRSDRREVIRQFQLQIANIQRKTVDWLMDIVFLRYPTDPLRKIITGCLNKVLFFEPFDNYCKIDSWPPENDRPFAFRVVTDVPLFADTIFKIFDMGAKKEIPLTPTETCEISYQLVMRAANIFQDPDLNYCVFHNFNDPDPFVKRLFDHCAYICPENAVFPVGYVPPLMAIVDSYWKVWTQLFVLGAHLPALFGAYCYQNFPTFQMFIEMAITNCFQFPPKSNEDLASKDLQFAQIEKMKILEFENYLAGNQEINETNSYLLSTLTTLDPYNFPRRPSDGFLVDFKNRCSRLRLFQLLYQSRNPDFLLIIIEQQQKSAVGGKMLSPMPWLVELVESNENNYGMLPVQCLCEFFFGQIAEEMAAMSVPHETTKAERTRKKEKRRKLIRLIAHFKTCIQKMTPENDLLTYLIRRLSSVQSAARTLAYKALYLIVSLKPEECLASLDEPHLPPLLTKESPDWLLTKLTKYMKDPAQIVAIVQAMIDALAFETDPLLICEYLDFIALHLNVNDDKLVVHCSQMLIQRKRISKYILSYSDNPTLKSKFLESLRKIYTLHVENLLQWNGPPQKPHPELVCIRFCEETRLVPILPFNMYGAVVLLSLMEHIDTSYSDRLSRLFFGSNGAQTPHVFNDFDGKLLADPGLVPDWMAYRLLCAQSNEVINLVIANVRPEQMIAYLEDVYGLSMNAIGKILQALDKLTAAKTKELANNLQEEDKKKLLNGVHTYWAKGITTGYKFAKQVLNYTGGKVELEEEMEVDPSTSKSKKEDKSADTTAATATTTKQETFKKDDIQRMFKEKDLRRLIHLSRQIAAELEDKSVKTKKLTKLFLTEFNANVDKLAELIAKGSFNSLFNVVIILVLKDSKHYGFNPEFQSIKKSLLALKLPNGGSIEDTTFWSGFERFFAKEPQKGKKTKQTKKKSYNLKSLDDLDRFLRTFSFACGKDVQNPAWCEIFKDLAVEKFYNKDTELEDSTELKSVIFSRNRPYFLSLLLHKSNFSTLNQCVDYLLNGGRRSGGDDAEESDEDDEESCQQLNPSAILNFLTICIDSPKLAVGRVDVSEQKMARLVPPEDVLQLTNEQIRKLIHFVVRENDVSRRIDLVLKSCCISESKTEFVVSLLKSYTDETEEKVASELYTRLYLHIPFIGLPSKLHDEHRQLIQKEPSFMDKITHNLITSFMFVEPNGPSISAAQFRSWELGILKIASTHPLLLIRQLPMIPALLSGKVNLLNYEAFKGMNLLTIFHKFLNILRLMRPHLWDKETRGVMQILDLYVDFFLAYCQLPRNKGPNEDLVPLLQKFIGLLDDWLKHDSDAANGWIKTQKQALTELSFVYHREQNMIKSIISGLPSQNLQMLAQSCHASLIKLRGSQSNQEKLMVALVETSKMSSHTPEIAEHLLDEVRTYLTNPSTCEIAFTMALKALQHNPNLSKSIISSYLRCFSSDAALVVNAAFNYLPDFVVLAQEYRYLIMMKAFELAVIGNQNAVTALNESFKALKAQLGC